MPFPKNPGVLSKSFHQQNTVFSSVPAVHRLLFFSSFYRSDDNNNNEKNLLIAAVNFDTVNTDCVRNR
jgi:hypothetical protein